jgi:hypothetical protein
MMLRQSLNHCQNIFILTTSIFVLQTLTRRVFEIFGPLILGVSEESEIEELVQSVFPDEMLKRVVSLEEFERTLVIQDGINNQS